MGRDKTSQFLKDTIAIISQTRQANPILLPSDDGELATPAERAPTGPDHRPARHIRVLLRRTERDRSCQPVRVFVCWRV